MRLDPKDYFNEEIQSLPPGIRPPLTPRPIRPIPMKPLPPIPFRLDDPNKPDEPALPDDGPPPGSYPVDDPALEQYDLDGDGFISPEELALAANDPNFILIVLRLDGMPANLRRFIARIIDGEMPGLGDIGNIRRLLKWLEKNPEYYPFLKRLLKDYDIPGFIRRLLPKELRD